MVNERKALYNKHFEALKAVSNAKKLQWMSGQPDGDDMTETEYLAYCYEWELNWYGEIREVAVC